MLCPHTGGVTCTSEDTVDDTGCGVSLCMATQEAESATDVSPCGHTLLCDAGRESSWDTCDALGLTDEILTGTGPAPPISSTRSVLRDVKHQPLI